MRHIRVLLVMGVRLCLGNLGPCLGHVTSPGPLNAQPGTAGTHRQARRGEGGSILYRYTALCICVPPEAAYGLASLAWCRVGVLEGTWNT
jgi:hypothetical protein